MGEVAGTPPAVDGMANDLRGPLQDVLDAVEDVRARAQAYACAPSTVPTTRVAVPDHLGRAVEWIRDLADALDTFSADLEAWDHDRTPPGRGHARRPAAAPGRGGLDQRDDGPASIAPGLSWDSVDRGLDAAVAVEAGLHLGLTPWRDAARYAHDRVRLWHLDRRLATASDFRAPGRSRPRRRDMMRRHNRPIRNEIRRLDGRSRAARSAVARGRGGAWTRVRQIDAQWAGRAPRAAGVVRAGGRVLGVAGVAWSAGDVVVGLREGDHGRVGTGVAGLGAAAAFAAGGPIGIGIGVALVAGSLLYEHRDRLRPWRG